MVHVGRIARDWGAYAASGIARLAQKIEGRLRGKNHAPGPDRHAKTELSESAPPSPTGDDRPGHPASRESQSTQEPTNFDRRLEKTDATIRTFTVVSGIAAVCSALAAGVGVGVAIYTAAQIDGTTKQTERAISQLANVVSAEQDETNALDNGVTVATNEAENTNALIGPAATSASAAVRGLDLQQRDFLADERPRLILLKGTPEAENHPQFTPAENALTWNFAVINTGKSAALHIRIKMFLSIGTESPIPDQGILAQEELSHGESFYRTAIYRRTIPEDRIMNIIDGKDETVKLILILSYRDEFGKVYTDYVCERMLQNHNIALCEVTSDFSAPVLRILDKDK